MLLDWLEVTVRDHGVDVVRHNRSLLIGPKALCCTGELVEMENAVQLDVYVEWEDGHVLVESCAGWGATPHEQAQDATRAFALNALHPILEAMCDHSCGEQVERETLQIGERTFTMYCGPLVRWGTPEPPACEAWFEVLCEALRHEALPGDLHWVRLYAGLVPGEEPIREALLDNERWPGGLAAVDLLVPPPGETYAARRVFVILRDTSVSRDRGEVDVLRTIGDLSYARDGEHPSDIERRLQERGISAERARALVVFVPEALANHALRDFWTTPPTEYLRDGVCRACFDDEPVYVTVSRMAPTLFADPAWQGMVEFAMNLSKSMECAVDAQNRGLSRVEPPLLTLTGSLHDPERPIFLDFRQAAPPAELPPEPAPPAHEPAPETPSVWARITRFLRGR